MLVREVAVLRIDERSDAIVEARELRFDGGGPRERGGGGGGGCLTKSGGEMRGEVGSERMVVVGDELTFNGGFGRCGSFGGSALRFMYSPQSCDTDEVQGLMADAETFSYESSKLMSSRSCPFSPSPAKRPSSRSMGYVATKFDIEPGVVQSVPPSDDSDTEWKDEIEDAGTCPALGVAVPSKGAYG